MSDTYKQTLARLRFMENMAAAGWYWDEEENKWGFPLARSGRVVYFPVTEADRRAEREHIERGTTPPPY